MSYGTTTTTSTLASSPSMVWVVGASLAFTVSAAFMKAAQGFTRPLPSAVVGMASLVGAILLSRAAMTGSLSTAVVIGLGVEAVATVIVGAVILNERLHVQHGLGIALIVVGVGVLRLL